MMDNAFMPGDLVIKPEEPLLKYLLLPQKGKRCDRCFGVGPLKRCVDCKMMYYCSMDCQRKDWKDAHSIECKCDLFHNPISEIDGKLVEAGITVLTIRTLAKFYLHPDAETDRRIMYDGSVRSFRQMLSHENELVNTSYEYIAREMSRQLNKNRDNVLSKDIGFKLRSDPLYILRILGIWKTNSCQILNLEETEAIGVGLYVEASALNHSCRPNAVRTSRYSIMQVRAIAVIPRGEKPVISYMAGNRDRPSRQMFLKTHFNFECACELCRLEEIAPVISYSVLETMKMQVMSYTGTDYKAFDEMRKVCFNMFRKLYNEYDERISRFCFAAFRNLFRMAEIWKKVPMSILLEVAKDTEQRVRITYGVASDDYNELFTMMNKLNLQH